MLYAFFFFIDKTCFVVVTLDFIYCLEIIRRLHVEAYVMHENI